MCVIFCRRCSSVAPIRGVAKMMDLVLRHDAANTLPLFKVLLSSVWRDRAFPPAQARTWCRRAVGAAGFNGDLQSNRNRGKFRRPYGLANNLVARGDREK
jgi:hypothetical protein